MEGNVNWGDPRLPDRFWDKVAPCPVSGCWLWLGALSDNGYGVFAKTKREIRKAHRVAFEALVGAVPAGLDLDHRCRVRCCSNPAHLDPVTRAENLRRSPITAHSRKFATHCKRGHEFTPENTGGLGRARYCRACERMRYETKYKAQRKRRKAS
jgi:hypothetical protein